MNDPANIELGQGLFKQQCVKCHGKGAYPGKAPKLRAKKLSPEDIYLRVTYGLAACRPGRTCSPTTSSWRSPPI